MGDFTRQVQYGVIAGPHLRKFDRATWDAAMKNFGSDSVDRRLAKTGLFFDDLLNLIREHWNIPPPGMSANRLARIAIASTMRTLLLVDEHATAAIHAQVAKGISDHALSQIKIKLENGLEFGPDELIGGSGDGLRMILNDCRIEPDNDDFITPTADEFRAVAHLQNIASIYNAVVNFWGECAGLDYAVYERTPDDLIIGPRELEMEIARTVSLHRHAKIARADASLMQGYWRDLAAHSKVKICRVRLVTDVKMEGSRLQDLTLTHSTNAMDRSSQAILSIRMHHALYYKEFLHERLPTFNTLTLENVLDGWLVLQSLSASLFDSSQKSFGGSAGPADFADLAPAISSELLLKSLVDAAGFSRDLAQSVLDALTFKPKSGDLWTQPLLKAGDDYFLVTPCILSVNQHRILEGWMRQGGFQLDRRGTNFEIFCREQLQKDVEDFDLEEWVQVVSTAVEINPKPDREEEMDLVMIVGSTVVICELKCILWPDEAIEHSYYRRTIDEAVAQVSRKRDSVTKNYEVFKQRLEKMGYTAPNKPKVICCVLTNSAVLVGFPIRGVAVVDLVILRGFFNNEHVVKEERHMATGASHNRIVKKFYDDISHADTAIEDYLLDPPQLRRARDSVQERELELPMKFGSRKLIHLSYEVVVEDDLAKASCKLS